MKLKYLIWFILIVPALVLAACSSANTSGTAYKAVWITPTVESESVSIPLDTVTTKTNVHFNVQTEKGTATFMSYEYGDKINVRASICVPCRSQSFTLKGDKLVCDACGTLFSAVNGQGVSGACVSYPKAAADFETSGNNIIMSKANLIQAYEQTLTPGLP